MGMMPLLFLIVACSGAAGASLTLNDSHHGGTASIRVGEIVEIVLKSNPTTGYRWQVESVDRGILEQEGEPDFIPDRMARGAGGRSFFRFKAVAAGKTMLRLIYHRSFEKDQPPINVFEITLSVEE